MKIHENAAVFVVSFVRSSFSEIQAADTLTAGPPRGSGWTRATAAGRGGDNGPSARGPQAPEAPPATIGVLDQAAEGGPRPSRPAPAARTPPSPSAIVRLDVGEAAAVPEPGEAPHDEPPDPMDSGEGLPVP